MHLSTSSSDQIGQLRSFAARALLFAIGLGLLLAILNIVCVAYRQDYHEAQFREMLTNLVKADLVVFGDSQSYHGINPKYLEPLGCSAYNFSIRGAGPDYFQSLYNQIFRKYYHKPRVILYQADCFLFDPSHFGRQFDEDCEFFPWAVFLEHFFNPKADRFRLIRRGFAVFKTRDELRDWVRNREILKLGLDTGYHGYMPTWGQTNVKGELKPAIDPAKVHVFESLMDDFQRDGISVVLVQVPNYLPGLKRTDEIIAQNKLIETIAAKRGIPFLNYNGTKASRLNDSPEFFVDPTHLNQNGATHFSSILCRDLAETPPFGGKTAKPKK